MKMLLGKLVLAQVVLLAVGPGVSRPVALEAQTLEEVESLVRTGRAEDARVALSRWWEASGADAPRSDVQRGLWFRGILTVDPRQARLDFQRLVVEYPGGSLTDDATLRLAELAEATGEIADAARWYRSLARDYPGSAARLQAVSWLERNSRSVTQADAPRLASESGAPRVGDRGGSGATGDVTVQVGAFLDRERAEQLAARLRSGGLEPRLVRVQGSDLLRVRVGRFDDTPQATRLSERLVTLGYEAVIAVDAGREENAW